MEPRSSSNSSAASDAEERVRCNGGESMVDCAADVLWPPDEAAKDHNSRASDSRLPDMVDIHIVAKAKLQENGQCCSISFVLLYNNDNTSWSSVVSCDSVICQLTVHQNGHYGYLMVISQTLIWLI